jgi:hypothetical protein
MYWLLMSSNHSIARPSHPGPNTYAQFNPHVTVASQSPGSKPDFTAIATKLGNKKCTFKLTTVALGNTGPGGTVLTGKDEVSTNVNDAPIFGAGAATTEV